MSTSKKSLRVVLVGANGTIGSEIAKALADSPAEIIRVGRTSGDFQVDIADRKQVRALYEKIGEFDAVVNASGSVAFAPLAELSPEKWKESLDSKFLGQVNLVQEALPFIRPKGSFTLVSGILSSEYIPAGAAATAVNRAIEGFAQAAAIELPKQLRINVISPTVLTEALPHYGDFFPGFIPVDGWKVGQAYKKALFGAETGRIYPVV